MKITLTVAMSLFASFAFAQRELDQDWNAFNQGIDVTEFRGGEFRFKGFVRTEKSNRISSARLWARVDKKKGMGFFYNMFDKPITDSVWREYVIEGDIDAKAEKLVIGGLYFGFGKYYYDKFSVQIKPKGGSWVDISLKNPSFEKDSFQLDWKAFYKVKGYATSLSTNACDGEKSLMVDCTSRSSKSKFVNANHISIHYQQFGKGDTLLLLHGNSESLQSFSKQIPELEKKFFVIAMDSRGQGYSTKDDRKMSYELMADDVNSFLEALNIKNVNVLGWSDGGNIGLTLAMKHPEKVKKLAVMGANLYNDKTSVEEKINKMLLKDRTELIAEKKESNKFRIEMIDLLLNEPKINPEELKKIQCETLVMAGSKDVIKEAHTKLIAGKIPKSKLVIFEKGTHYEPTENPKRFNQAVIDFFSNPK